MFHIQLLVSQRLGVVLILTFYIPGVVVVIVVDSGYNGIGVGIYFVCFLFRLIMLTTTTTKGAFKPMRRTCSFNIRQTTTTMTTTNLTQKP